MSNPLPSTDRDPIQAFHAGDYATAALNGGNQSWTTPAALGLIGCPKPALAALKAFDGEEPRFYEAVTRWIDGDDSGALRGLEGLSLPHAKNLLALLRKPKIKVLSQCDRGSQWDFITAIRSDSRFEVVNYGFDANDQPIKAYADIRRCFDAAAPPDFYVAKMLEWHLLPPNLQQLPCPIFGHTADYDLHIQAVQPWLHVFDELLTTDQTEWNDVSKLTAGPVSVFPKAFGLALKLPDWVEQSRPLDVFISGTTQHPYHPDKARLIHQVLAQRDLKIKFLDGFLGLNEYLNILGHTRAAFTYIRHPGGMPTRGMESLAMGAAIAVQRESILRAYLTENEGLLTYSLEAGDLPDVLNRITREWADFEPKARRGAEIVRREFTSTRTASQYFRFLTFLAAKPRAARRVVPSESLRQKRSIFCKGWAWRPAVNRSVRQRSIAEWTRDLTQAPAPEPIIDGARELVLEFATAAYFPAAQVYAKNFNARLPIDRNILTRALELYKAGMRRFPQSLVLRFNAIRTALHFGEPEEVTEAIQWGLEAIELPREHWQISPKEDVFPWDFFGQFFNYRTYFDRCTLAFQQGEEQVADLASLMLGSIAYYVSCYQPESWSASEEGKRWAGKGRTALARFAIEQDPEFPFYAYRYATSLLETGAVEDLRIAETTLISLARHSMLHGQAAAILRRLNEEGKSTGPEVAEILKQAAQTEERLHRTLIGKEDWETIPLRAAAIPSSPPVVVQPPKAAAAKGAKVLYLCLEFAQWQHARRLAYPAGLGMEEGFRANGVDFTTIPSICGLSKDARRAWQQQVQELCRGQSFDQVWVELVHSEWDEEFWSWIMTLAPVRVGLIMESLRYEPHVYAQAPNLRDRRAHVEKRLQFVTHALCIDEADAQELNQARSVSALWWPQTIPGRLVRDPRSAAPDKRAIFSGSIYGSRNEWLQNPELSKLLTFQSQPGEEATRYPTLFDEAHRTLDGFLAGGGKVTPALLEVHLETWRRIRIACFELWLKGLQGAGPVVNLTSFVRGYAGRVLEGMAAGRPVLSWRIPERPKTLELFEEESEILLFAPDDPLSLAAQLRRLESDARFAQSVAERGWQKVRQAHTVERRVAQILDWVATGTVPDFKTPPGTPPVALPPTLNAAAAESCVSWAPILGVLGETRAAQGKFAEALPILDLAASLKANDLQIQITRARVSSRVGALKSLQDALDAAFRVDDRSSAVLRLASEVSRSAGLFDLGVQFADFSAVFGPEEVESYVEVVQSRLAGTETPPIAALAPQLSEPLERMKGKTAARVTATGQAPQVSERPVTATLGNLEEALAHATAGHALAAWNAAVQAIEVRPFHPEAWMLLAKLALATGDVQKARACGERASRLAPRWKEAKQFVQKLPKRAERVGEALPDLPATLARSGETPRLSVCIIAKNEERFLESCLKSIRGIAHQIVVTDTGSTDRTVEIAQRLGAEVHHFDWCDDFSAARNACLQHASGDWVLSLDADEELLPESVELLKQSMANGSVIAWRLPLADAGKENEGYHYVPRLFRNAPGVFFKGRIHEHAFDSLTTLADPWGLENRLGTARLRHHGYTDQMVKDRSKVQRNLRLLERAIEEQPGDVSLHMSYALDLVKAGQLDAGLEEYSRAFKLIGAQPTSKVPPELRERLVTLMTTHLITAQRFQSVVELSETPTAKATGPTASLHLMFGVASYVQKNFTLAAQHLRHCIAKRNQAALSPIHSDIHTGGPRHLLALCYCQLEKKNEAEKEYRASLQEDPKATKVRFDYARFLHQTDRPLPALEQLNEIVAEKPSELAAWRFGAEIVHDHPEFLPFGLDWTSEATKSFPQDSKLGLIRAELLTRAGECAQALTLWKRFQEPENLAHAASVILCELLSGGAFTPVASERELGVSQAFCARFRQLVGVGSEEVVRHIAGQLPRLESVLPSAAQALQAVLTEAHAA